jgi:hypothetical protein
MGKSAQDIYATALTILQVGQPAIQLPPNPNFNSLSPEEKDRIYQDLHNQVNSLVHEAVQILSKDRWTCMWINSTHFSLLHSLHKLQTS